MARKYVEANQISKENIIELSQLQNIAEKDHAKYNKLKVLVVLDDFAGSGKTLDGLIKEQKDILNKLANEKNIKVILIVAYCMDGGREKILRTIEKEAINIQFYTPNSLDETEKIFSHKSRYFVDENEKNELEIVFKKEGAKLVKNNPLGFANSQVAIVFPENCPNNSLPILWENKNKWIPLFKRRKN